MNEEIKIEKKFNKAFYTVNENIEFSITIENLSNHTLKNISYQLEEDIIKLDEENVEIDEYKIVLRTGTKAINIGDLSSKEKRKISFIGKAKDVPINGVCTAKAYIKYVYYGEERVLPIEDELLIQGVKLEFEYIKRSNKVLYLDEKGTYKLKIKNTGNIVASNVNVRFSNKNLKTVIDSVKIDDSLYKDVFIEEGINIGSIFTGDYRLIQFSVKGKDKFKNSEEEKIYLTYEAVVCNELVKLEEVINLEATVLIRDDFYITKTSNKDIIDETNKAIINIKLKNNTGSKIDNLRLREIYNSAIKIKDVKINNEEAISIEGDTIIISKIENEEEMDITYGVVISENSKEDFLETYSELIYNIGAMDVEKRFKVESNKIGIELNGNRVQIEESVSAKEMQVGDIFNRKIVLKNIGFRDIKRARIFDKVSEGIKILKGSLNINSIKINNIDNLTDGIDIGEIGAYKSVTITYDGEITELFKEDTVEFLSYLTYSIKGDFTDDVITSTTKKRKNKIGVDRVSKEIIIQRKIDISKLALGEIASISGEGHLKDIRRVNSVKEIQKEGRFIPISSFMVNGIVYVNLEYTSYYESKLCSLNIPIEFKETISGKNELKNRNYGNLTLKDIKGIINKNMLELIIVGKISIS